MILELSQQGFAVLEKDDLKRLKLVVPAGWDTDAIRSGLPFAAKVEAAHVWIAEADLRALSGAGPAGSGDHPIDAMIQTARKYGFFDDASDSVRVHIEYAA